MGVTRGHSERRQDPLVSSREPEMTIQSGPPKGHLGSRGTTWGSQDTLGSPSDPLGRPRELLETGKVAPEGTKEA